MIELSKPVQVEGVAGPRAYEKYSGSLIVFSEGSTGTSNSYRDAEPAASPSRKLQAPAEIGSSSSHPSIFPPSTPPRGALSPSMIPHQAPQPDANFGGRFASTSATLPSPARAGFRFGNATPVSTPLASASSPRPAVSLITARALEFEQQGSTSPSQVGLFPAFGEDDLPETSPIRRSIVRMGAPEMGESWGRRQSLRDRPIEYATWGTPGTIRPMAIYEDSNNRSSVLLAAATDYVGPSADNGSPPRDSIPLPVAYQPLAEVIALGEGLAGGPQRDLRGRKINLKKWRQEDPLAEAGGVGNAFGANEVTDSQGKAKAYRHRFSRSVSNFFSTEKSEEDKVRPAKPAMVKRFTTNLRSMSVTNLIANGGRPHMDHGAWPSHNQSAGERAGALFATGGTPSPHSSRSPPPDVPERGSSHRSSAYLRRRARLETIDSGKSKLPYSHSMPALLEFNDYQRGAAEKVQTWLIESPTRPTTMINNGEPIETQPYFGTGQASNIVDRPVTPPTVASSSATEPVKPWTRSEPERPAPLKRSSWTARFKRSTNLSESPQPPLFSGKIGHGRTVSSSVLPDKPSRAPAASPFTRPARHARSVSSSTVEELPAASKPSLLYRLRNASTISLAKKPLPGPAEKELPPIPDEQAPRSGGLRWLRSRAMRSSVTLVNSPLPSPATSSRMESPLRSPTSQNARLSSLAEAEDEGLVASLPRRFIEVNLDSGMFSVEELLGQVDESVARSPNSLGWERQLASPNSAMTRGSLDSTFTATTTSGASYNVEEAAIGHVLSAPFINVDPEVNVDENGTPALTGLLAFPAPPDRPESRAGATTPIQDGLRTPRAGVFW